MSEIQNSLMQQVFERQAATAVRLRSSGAAERIDKIRRLREAVIARTEAWYQAAWADFKKPAGEVDLAEILPVCLEANDAVRNLGRWMKPRRVQPTLLTLGTRAYVEYVPRGRCLIIGPFNYPVNLTLGPLVSAIAAGNTAILKPSELTPHLSKLICEVVREVFSEDEVAIFEGEAEVSKALLKLPFDHIFFTGSPTIGKAVMGAAAQNLSSVTLELGGKSPTIIDESADLSLAAANVMWAKFANAGQTCIAPDHVYVHESVKEAWIGHCREQLQAAYASDHPESMGEAKMAHIVNARHTARLQGLLDDARTLGARTLTGGNSTATDCFIEPTLLDQVDAGSRIMQEEIFGPLLPVIGYRSLDEVVGRINAGSKPLALYIYSRNAANIQQVLSGTVSGGACVNHAMIHFLHGKLPFGGINHSGIGNAHGQYGFKAFSHERAVLHSRSRWATGMLRAGEIPVWMRKAIRLALRVL